MDKQQEAPVTWPGLKNIGKVTVRDIEIEGGNAISKIAYPEETVVKQPVIDDAVLATGKGDEITSKIKVDGLSEVF